MSAWRKKAMDCLPECKQEFENPVTSIYDVFIELLPSTVNAHRHHDIPQLEKNYAFAEWCFRQRAKDLWNATAVSFYEHLGDQEETTADMNKWVRRDIYQQIRPLLEHRLNSDQLRRIDNLYQIKGRPDHPDR